MLWSGLDISQADALDELVQVGLVCTELEVAVAKSDVGDCRSCKCLISTLWATPKIEKSS